MEIGKYWKTIVDTLHDGLMVLDPEGNILAMNPAAEELTGYKSGELVGQNCQILNCTGCELYGRGAGEEWCSLYVKGIVKAKKCLIAKKDRRALHVVKNASVLRDSAGQMIGAVETFTDISEIVRQQQEIETLRRSCRLEEDHHGLLGESLPMQRLFELIENVAQTDAPVLIHGLEQPCRLLPAELSLGKKCAPRTIDAVFGHTIVHVKLAVGHSLNQIVAYLARALG